MENVLPTLEPVVPVETKEETPTMDFVPEPKQIEGMMKMKYHFQKVKLKVYQALKII